MLSRWQSTIVDAQGNVQPHAVLRIRKEQDQSLALVYRSNSDLQPYPLGLVAADINGFAYFYAPPGRYRIQSIGLNIDWRDVEIGALSAARAALENSGMTIYGTHADMMTDVPSESPVYARVVNDANPDLNGYYIWNGSGWERTTEQPADVRKTLQIDEVSETPGPSLVPRAREDGSLDLDWLGPDMGTKLSMLAVQVNHIGIPGRLGFGVGICPELPDGYNPLAGTYAIGAAEYGNYRYRDGSIMAWIPAHYCRIGHADNPTYDEYGVNSIDIQPYSAFANRDEAAAAGYMLPRAFIDGGEIVLGFMHDKYRSSNNNGIASSIKGGDTVRFSTAHNPISDLNGVTGTAFLNMFDAAKTRGSQFFPASRFMRATLAHLSLAHGQAATGDANCAWYDSGLANFPKGNNNNAYSDTNDTSITFTPDTYAGGNSALTGSGMPFAKTTHNGQDCGVADLNGNIYTVEPGLTCLAVYSSITDIATTNPVVVTAQSHGGTTGQTAQILSVEGTTELNGRLFKITVIDDDSFSLDGVDGTGFTPYESAGEARIGSFYVPKETTRMEDFTGGNTEPTDHFGAVGVANMMEELHDLAITDYPNNLGTQRFGNGANQVMDPATGGDGWIKSSLGMPLQGGVSPAGAGLYGNDYYRLFVVNLLCPISGMNWSTGSSAGAWTANFYYSRADTTLHTGLCSASYPVRSSGSED